MASDWLGVSIAPAGTVTTPTPTWERLDVGVDGLRVSSISIHRGRQSEFDETATGSCTVTFNDRAGVLDPTNALSPYFNELLSRPLGIALRNPLTDEWHPLFRGAVDEAGLVLTKTQQKLEHALVAVDAFDYFSNFELVPGLAGELNSAGYVIYPVEQFQDRLIHIFADVGWPDELYVDFSGNVWVDESRYSPGDTAMQAILECVDAEFPTVANAFVDKRGRVMVLGRYARFFPDYVSEHAPNWEFHRWKAGDNATAAADVTVAKMQAPFGFQLTRKQIYNAALAYPQTADRRDLDSYVFTDSASRAAYGTRTWTANDLKIESGGTTGNTAKEECLLFAEYVVTNHKDPKVRVEEFRMGSERLSTVYAPAVWELLLEVDISDVIEITLEHPGGGGFASHEFYVEGLHYEITPGPGTLDESYPIVRMTADLSPAGFWTDCPFPDPTVS